MMIKNYKNSEEITRELKRLKLKRDISVEEIKLIKQQFKDDISLNSWIQTAVKSLGRLGAYSLAKKIIR